MQLTIPTTEDIRRAVRDELAAFFSSNQFLPKNEPPDEIGGVELAARITGLAIPTIYDKVCKRQIPFSKPEGNKKLTFSKRELENWLKSGRRKTVSEIQAEI